MTETPAKQARERLGRPPRFVIAVTAAVLLLVAGWSAVWYAGTRRADAMITAWLAGEAAKGRTYGCGERHLGGYPFRVEVTCTAPHADIADAAPRLRLAADGFRAIAQVWDLTHVIFEVDGPLRIEAGRGRTAIDADWQLLQGSLRAPGGLITRLDLAATDLTVAPDARTVGPGRGVRLTARRVGVHSRSDGKGAADGRDLDVAVDAEDLVVALADSPASEAVDLTFLGRLDALPYPPPRGPADFLAAWRKNGGSIEVKEFSAAQGESELRASGRLTPDDAGRPEGTVTVSLAGPDVMAPGLGGSFGGLGSVVALALRLTGRPTEIDGREALAGELEFRNGQVFLGSVAIAEVPRIF